MKRILKIIGLIIGGLLLAVVLGAVVLFLITGGDYRIPATVTDDLSLPAIDIHGIRLHAETFGSPGNPVVVVLHGGPGSDAAFRVSRLCPGKSSEGCPGGTGIPE